MKKFVKKALISVLAIFVLAVIAVYAVWHNEISTAASIKLIRERNDSHLDGAVYMMHVKGGFYLDDFVGQGGVKNDSELISFVTEKITKGLLDIGISDPEIGCSSFTAKTKDGDALFDAITIFPRPTPASFLPMPMKDGTLRYLRWIFSFWA